MSRQPIPDTIVMDPNGTASGSGIQKKGRGGVPLRRSRLGPPPLDLDQDPTVDRRVFLDNLPAGCRAICSLGPISEGHSLLCPPIEDARRSGSLSCYDFARRCSTRVDFAKAVCVVCDRLSKRFKRPVVIFEHGGVDDTVSDMCGTLCPHLHILPVTNEIKANFARESKRCLIGEFDSAFSYTSIQEFLGDRRGVGEYLLAGSPEFFSVMWAGSNQTFPSQRLRHVLQLLLGQPLDSWRDNLRTEEVVELAASLRRKFA